MSRRHGAVHYHKPAAAENGAMQTFSTPGNVGPQHYSKSLLISYRDKNSTRGREPVDCEPDAVVQISNIINFMRKTAFYFYLFFYEIQY